MSNPPVSPTTLDAFLEALPKTETHLHIEGALPLDLLQRVAPTEFIQPPSSWAGDFRYDSFEQFERHLINMALYWYKSPERYHRAVELILGRLYDEEHVRYVEMSFASGMIEYQQLNVEAVARAVKSAVPKGMTMRLFVGIHHNGYHAKSREMIEACLRSPFVDGVDLHGAEDLPLEAWTADVWKRARSLGKATKAHAGEFCGPEFIQRCLDELGVRRIEHGVRAIESPELVRRLAAEGIVLDICPISNLKLRVIESLERHPLRALLEAGVRCTINTDDPLCFGNRLRDDYRVAHQAIGLSLAQLAQVARHGFEHADMDPHEKRIHLDTIDRLAATVS